MIYIINCVQKWKFVGPLSDCIILIWFFIRARDSFDAAVRCYLFRAHWYILTSPQFHRLYFRKRILHTGGTVNESLNYGFSRRLASENEYETLAVSVSLERRSFLLRRSLSLFFDLFSLCNDIYIICVKNFLFFDYLIIHQ